MPSLSNTTDVSACLQMLYCQSRIDLDILSCDRCVLGKHHESVRAVTELGLARSQRQPLAELTQIWGTHLLLQHRSVFQRIDAL